MSYISTYPLSPSDICVPVKLEYESSELTVNEPWIFGAFFLGLIFGIVVTALLVPCCLRSLAKKQLWRRKAQDEEELVEEKAVHVRNDNSDVIYAYNVRDKPTSKKLKFGKKKGRKGKRGEDNETEEEEIGADPDVEKPPLDPALCHGIGDILVKDTIEGAEAEMSKQDVDKVDRVTRDLRREKDDMFLKQLKMQLRRMKVGDVSLSEIVNNVMEDLVSKARMYKDEKQEVEDETRQQMSKDKNTEAVQTEVDKLDSQLEQKLVKLHEDERDFIRQELSKRTDLKEDEIEALMAALLKDMANLEKKLGHEFQRQNRGLEERLAKRRQILEFRKLQDQQFKEELKDNVEIMEETVKDMVNNKDMSGKQATQLINQYMLDLQKIHSKQEKEANRHLEDLAEKLRAKRLRRMNQIQNKHERERAVQKEKLERGGDTGDMSKGFHDLLQKQRSEMEVTETEIDQQELQEIDNLKQKLSSDQATQVNNRTEKIQKELEGFGQDSHKAEKIIDLHKARMQQLNEKRMDERNKMAAKLRERWERKMLKLDEQEQQSFVEKESMNEQQNQTVNRVLSTSVELTDEAKKKIIREHQHNMEVLNNQLDKSKVRQQRNIEYRLNERRAKTAALRKQKEDAMANKAKASKEEMEKLEKQLEEEIALEEQNIQKAREAALLQLRQQLAKETEEALAQGEVDLSVLIGRMEVGSARRQLVLQKQDTMLQSLQDQLENKLAKGGVQMSGADQIIQQHNNQVDHLNQQLQASREDQEYNIREKIQAMKLQKERELAEKRELHEKMGAETQQKKSGSLRRRGASKASDVLGTLFLQQKHSREVQQLEEEMMLELERSKEELNRQLQLELESELKNQKQQFITQLAATSGMSQDDIQDTVDSANIGGNQKKARKLARELKDGMQRAKTDLQMDQYMDEPENRPSSRFSRPSSGRPGSGSTDGGLRPKSGLKKKAKRSSVAPAKESWGAEDYSLYHEDDF
ncbi:trichohyalin-like isoform X2 [Mizuhopecten yessoensis]|uniref:trichohyalin-like isoform X2 n=1 Tax=Mizuhopecten yessoensis TaxID=6573 RepID=UPI000B457A2F|nr:trichohyalin-like isoform X2 [Mizuhopecten yessoensis]